MSDPLSRMPRGLVRVSSVALLLLRDVTGKLSLAIGGLCCVRARKLLLLVLRCYGFWMVSPVDGEARDPRPASGLSASSKLKREEESDFSNWCPVLNRRISTCPRRLNQSNRSCGVEPCPARLWGISFFYHVTEK